MRAMERWRSEETEDGVRCHACHGKMEEMSCVPWEGGVRRWKMGRDVMRAMGRWSEEMEDGERRHACHGKVE